MNQEPQRRQWVSDRLLICSLAIISAVLYACVLPLWEGFDEPFHYAYLQLIADRHALPVFGRTSVSGEVFDSLFCVPLSRLLSVTLPGSLSFEEWSRLPLQQRNEHRAKLLSIEHGKRLQDSSLQNYETQQAPLAYVVSVPVYWLSAGMKIEGQVLLVRFWGALLCLTIFLPSLFALGRIVGVTTCYRLSLIVGVLLSQMLWATVSHVGNDWLAVPLALAFVVLLGMSASSQRNREPILLSCCLALGLLTKAYFFVFAPIFVALLISKFLARDISLRALVACCAIPALMDAPWYIRNLKLYGSLSGTQQSIEGIGSWQALTAVPRINWIESLWNFAHWSVWTGNWSFVSFARTPVTLEIVLITGGLLLFIGNLRKASAAAIWMSGAVLLFVADCSTKPA